MSTPFSRTLRSLHADNFRPSLIFLAMAIILIIAWLAWFALAQISIYESSESLHATQGGNVAAVFPAATLAKIKPGQRASLELRTDESDVPQLTDAVVYSVDIARGEVTLFPETSLNYLFRQPQTLSGKVSIAVETLSPAALLFQSSSGGTP